MVNTNVGEGGLYGGLTMEKTSTNSIIITHCCVVELVLTYFQYLAYNTLYCIFAILNILHLLVCIYLQ